MKFIFEKIQEKTPNEYGVRRLTSNKNTNGLLVKILECYSNHYKLTISPDEILNTVACIYSKYVNHNAQRFREYFTDSKEKKEISLFYGGDFYSCSKNFIILDLLDEVKKAGGSSLFEWLNVNFSTSNTTDSLVRALSVLSSQKEYYSYSCTFCCGFPSVELLGTPEDWSFLINTLMLMPTLEDSFLTKWKSSVIWLVTKMLSGEEEFWQSGITRIPYGSGGQADYQGWVLILNPFNENMDILNKNIEEKDVLNLNVDIDVNINNNGDEFLVKFLGGPSEVCFDDSFKVNNNLRIFKHDQGKLVEIS